jgi:hypothetical protein
MSVLRKLLVLSVSILVLTKSSNGVCPLDEVTEPCTCAFDNFVCAGNTIVNYKTLFDRISKDLTPAQKMFHSLTLSNEAITEIVDDEFRDLVFTEINIKNAKNLKRIYPHAFTNIADYIEIFQQSGPSLLGDEDAFVPELFQALSSLVNVRIITLGQTKIKFIPDNAFSNINQNKLTHLEINSGMIAKVGDYAFYYLNSLTYLKLEKQQLNHIAQHAFDLEKSSTSTLEVHLNDNLIEDSGIEINAFVGTKRPLLLNLANNVLTHLKEDIFKPILTANANTKVYVTGNQFRCNCLNEWLVIGKAQYITRVLNAVCSDAPHAYTDLFSLKRSDFDICHGYFE